MFTKTPDLSFSLEIDLGGFLDYTGGMPWDAYRRLAKKELRKECVPPIQNITMKHYILRNQNPTV